MTIVFGAQNTSIIFFFNSAEPRPTQQQQLCSLTHFGFSLCVFAIGTA